MDASMQIRPVKLGRRRPVPPWLTGKGGRISVRSVGHCFNSRAAPGDTRTIINQTLRWAV
jgi:hypothetical protein